MTSLNDLQSTARNIKQRNLELQLRSSGRRWTKAETMLGFVTDVGDLARLVMEAETLRPPSTDLRKRIEHELADCLWSVLTLADELEVDLAQALQGLAANVENRTT